MVTLESPASETERRFCRHLLLHFFRRPPGPLGDDRDVVIGDVGIGLDGQVVERNSAPDRQQNRGRDHHEAVIKGEIDKGPNHISITLSSRLMPLPSGRRIYRTKSFPRNLNQRIVSHRRPRTRRTVPQEILRDYR